MQISTEIASIFAVYSLILIGSLGAIIVAGFLSGRHTLLSYRNTFLAGFIIFNGLSTLGLALSRNAYSRVQLEDATQFILYSTLFIVTYLFVDSKIPVSKWSQKLFSLERLDPAATMLPLLLIIAFVTALHNFTLARIFYLPFLGEFLRSVSSACLAFASLFAYAYWTNNRISPFRVSVTAVIIGSCMVLSVMSGSGRRNFLGVLAAIIVFAYWSNASNFDYQRKLTILTRTGIGLFVLMVVLAGYNKTRHFRLENKREGRSLGESIAALKRIPDNLESLPEDLQSGELVVATGQDATKCSLLLMKLEQSHVTAMRGSFNTPSPFQSVIFAISNPIPRSLWRGKPLSLGYMLPIVGLRTRDVNLGPGIVGHCVYEGGIFFIFFYAALFAAITRTLDHALEANPFDLLHQGLFATIFPNLIALPRGDQGVVMITLVFGIIGYGYLCIFTRLLRRYVVTNQQQQKNAPFTA